MICTSWKCTDDATEHFNVYADGEQYGEQYGETAHKCDEHAEISRASIAALGWTWTTQRIRVE